MNFQGTLLLLWLASLGCVTAPQPRGKLTSRDPLQGVRAEQLFEQGKKLAQAQDFIRAEQYLAAALSKGLLPERGLPLLLEVCISSGRFQSALQHTQAALSAQPGNWRLRYMAAVLEQSLGNASRALVELQRAIHDNPRAAAPRYHMGMLLWNADRVAAEAHLRAYLALSPAGHHAANARAMLQQAMPLSQTGPPPTVVPASAVNAQGGDAGLSVATQPLFPSRSSNGGEPPAGQSIGEPSENVP